MPDQLTVMVVVPPTVNGPLHLGHLSGPYLAADVAARAARARGERVLELGGVDIHQNFVPTMADRRGIDVDKLVDEYAGRIADAYRLARIDVDAAYDPRDAAHQATITGAVAALVADGTLPVRDVVLYHCADCLRTLHHSYVVGTCARCGAGASGGSCEGCGGYTSAQDLLDPRCDRCGGAPVAFRAKVPVLPMEDLRERLTAVWTRAELSPRARDLVAGYLSDGLPDIPLAYPTDWGVPFGDLRLDVYFELALSTFHAVARYVDPTAATPVEHRRAWNEVGDVWHFNGIDNGFYFALLWPAVYLLLGARPEQLAGTISNEFLTLDGAKFSTSRDHAIWADEFLAVEDPEVVRLLLAWERPGTRTSDFTVAAYRRFERWVRPLLDGTATAADGIPTDVEAELRRGEHALHPRSFDLPLAVRCLVSALAAGDPATRLRAALGGGS